jgi:lipocalin-like protein
MLSARPLRHWSSLWRGLGFHNQRCDASQKRHALQQRFLLATYICRIIPTLRTGCAEVLIVNASENAIGRRPFILSDSITAHSCAATTISKGHAMFRVNILALSAIALGFSLTGSAVAQQKTLKEQIVGTWSVVSWVQTYPDGRKDEGFGPNPNGIHSFNPDGHFSVIFVRRDLPKLASNDRITPTAQEAMAVAKGVIAYFGTYTVNEADKSVSLSFEGTSYTNQLAQQPQKRIVTSISADELKYRNPASTAGGQIEVAFKRAK